jgi:hypothetical protein
MLACVAALITGLPLFAWAQSPTPPPAPAALPDTTRKSPAPVAAQDSATATAVPPAIPLSDSAKAAIRTQITRELAALADTLKLTPEQRAKAKPIMLDHGYQLSQLRDKYAAQPKTPAVAEEMKKEAQSLRDATDTKLALVFTGEQMAVFKQKRDEGLTRIRSKMGVVAPATKATKAAPAAPATPALADTTKKK